MEGREEGAEGREGGGGGREGGGGGREGGGGGRERGGGGRKWRRGWKGGKKEGEEGGGAEVSPILRCVGDQNPYSTTSETNTLQRTRLYLYSQSPQVLISLQLGPGAPSRL